MRKIHMKIIAVVGMPGSGKSTVLDRLAAKGIPVFNMGDVVTKIEPKIRGIKESSEAVEHKIRTELREKLGMAAIAIRTVEEVRKQFKDAKVVAIGGIHSPAELNHFKKEFGSNLFSICLDCSPETRLTRKKIRQERPVNEEEFWHREKWEKSVGIDEVMGSANIHVDNEGTQEKLILQIDSILEELGI